jgi:hypothetical protein
LEKVAVTKKLIAVSRELKDLKVKIGIMGEYVD